MEEKSWRSNIVNQLHTRNKRETYAFQEIFSYQSKLFDSVNALKNENVQLQIRFSGDGANSYGTTAANEKVHLLEKKVLAQQEELTSLHRSRGENGQMIIDLNTRVNELEKQLREKDQIISENNALISSLRAEIRLYHNNMTELESMNQTLRDEHQALQMAFTASEDKLRKVQDENRALVERLIKYKAKDADKMNEENESFLKSSNAFLINTFGRVSFGKKGDKVRKELEEAAKEGGSRSSTGSGGSTAEDKLLDAIPYYSIALPSKAALKFDAHDGEVYAVKWSPTDRLVATGGADRKVKLWDVCKMSTSECVCKGHLVGSNAGVMSVDFDSTGAFIVAASNDYASRVWAVADQRLRHSLTGHSGKVMAAKFLGESTKVITGSHDRTLKIWDLGQRKCCDTKFAGSSCNDLVTSDGAGSTIISGHFDQRVRFWDIRTPMSANDIKLQGRITSLDLSRDCNYLLACVRDDTIQLIDLRNSAIVRSFNNESFKVGCDWTRAAFGPAGRLIAVGGADGSVFVWNTYSGKLETVLKDHTSAVTAVAWHPQSGLLASVDRAKKMVVWGDL